MSSENYVSFIGRIATDLGKINYEEGKPIQFMLAVDKPHKPEDTVTCHFIPIKVWGKKAENLVKFKGKGDLINIMGHVNAGYYEKEDKQIFAMEIVADSIKYLASCKRNEEHQEQEQENEDNSNQEINQSSSDSSSSTRNSESTNYVNELLGEIPFK